MFLGQHKFFHTIYKVLVCAIYMFLIRKIFPGMRQIFLAIEKEIQFGQNIFLFQQNIYNSQKLFLIGEIQLMNNRYSIFNQNEFCGFTPAMLSSFPIRHVSKFCTQQQPSNNKQIYIVTKDEKDRKQQNNDDEKCY